MQILDNRGCDRGVRASQIFYQPGDGDSSESRTGSWIIQSFYGQKFRMILPPKDSKKYPFGRFQWEIGMQETVGHMTDLHISGPGVSICQKAPGEMISLTMSSCDSETFTCNSGACIPLANKCNSKIDCEDESDESQCAYLEVSPATEAKMSTPSWCYGVLHGAII